MDYIKKIHLTLIILIPFALITGPFLPDLIVVLSSIFFLIFIFIEKNFFYLKNKFFLLFILWCFYLIIRSLLSDNIFLSLESSLFHFRFGIFALSIWYALNNYNNFSKLFFFSLLIAFFIVILDGYLQYFTNYNILGLKYDGLRLSGLFGSEQIMGSYLSRLTPILFALLALLKFNNKISFLVIIFILTSVDILVFLSGERSAFFYVLMSTLIIIILVRNWKFVRMFTFGLSLIAITLITYSSESVKSRMIDQTVKQLNIQDKSDNINTFSPQHEAIYITSWILFEDNVFFGIGPKMFREKCSSAINIETLRTNYKNQDVNLNTINSCSTHSHNTYLQLLVETGIIGAIPVIAISIFLFYLLAKHFIGIIFRRKYIFSDYNICMLAALLITLWPFIPTGNFFNNWLNVIYFLPVGFLLHSRT